MYGHSDSLEIGGGGRRAESFVCGEDSQARELQDLLWLWPKSFRNPPAYCDGEE